MIGLKDGFTIAEQVGTIMTRIDALRRMTLMQWVTLAGYAVIGAGTGYASTGSWIGAVIGAGGGIVGHLVPLMQTSPVDKIAAQVAVAKDAEAHVVAAEVAGQTLMEQADTHKPLDKAAADFSKEMAAS